jgi:hypothetical protein
MERAQYDHSAVLNAINHYMVWPRHDFPGAVHASDTIQFRVLSRDFAFGLKFGVKLNSSGRIVLRVVFMGA